jgi:hypothetical protein
LLQNPDLKNIHIYLPHTYYRLILHPISRDGANMKNLKKIHNNKTKLVWNYLGFHQIFVFFFVIFLKFRSTFQNWVFHQIFVIFVFLCSFPKFWSTFQNWVTTKFLLFCPSFFVNFDISNKWFLNKFDIFKTQFNYHQTWKGQTHSEKQCHSICLWIFQHRKNSFHSH